MRETAEKLRGALDCALPLLEMIPEAKAADKPLPGKWSPKEIIGHLIDSACNNQQKFVRAMAETRARFPGYAQDLWVATQRYNERSWNDLITFWHLYNPHIAHIIENADPESLQNKITIIDAGEFTLEFIMQDYVEHLKHHLLQILPDAPLKSNFKNIYNT